MPISPDRRSPCPVACTLDLLGDKWTLLVIRDLFAGKTKFQDFLQSPERIATNILTDRLKTLADHGLIQRESSPTHAARYTYTLTPKGRSLLPLLQSVATWGLHNIPGTKALLASSSRASL